MHTAPGQTIKGVFQAAVLFAACFTTGLEAETQTHSEPLATNLHAFVTQSYYVMNHTHRYQQNIGDIGTRTKIDDALATAKQAMQTSLSQGAEPPVEGKLTQISGLWGTYQQKLDVTLDDMDSRGYPDSRLMAELSQIQYDMAMVAQSVYLEDNSSLEFVRKSRQLSDDVAYMMTTYTERSGGLTTAKATLSDMSLDQYASLVDERFDQLQHMAANQALKKPIQSALTKWQFIRKSFVNYNENNVNFITNLYSQKIIEHLQQATETYITQQANGTIHQVASR